MRLRTVLARLAFASTSSLGVIGCMSLAGLSLNPLDPVVPPDHPRPAGPVPVAVPLPDLRIADNTPTPQTEIPIVPLPGIPGPATRTDAGNAVRVEDPPATVKAGSPPPAPAVQVPPVQPPPVQAPAVPRAQAPEGLEAVRQVYGAAAQRYAALDSYIVRLTRREQVRGKDSPEDIILFKFRKEPWSLYFKWVGPSGHGREVVYCKGRYGDKIQTLLAAGDHPFAGAGTRMEFAVDSILVRSSSRHCITEAGIGASIERLGGVLEAVERGDSSRGTLTFLGPQVRPEFPRGPVPVVEHVIPPGVEATLPRGGRRLYAFDPESKLPLLIVTRDETGHEVEYYLHDRLQAFQAGQVGLDDDDFNPDKLWKKK